MTSRYGQSEELVYSDDGRTIVYLAPRILPLGSEVSDGRTTVVSPAEVNRLDILSFRVLKNPLLAYRVADANDAIDPLSLCTEAGTTLLLPGTDL